MVWDKESIKERVKSRIGEHKFIIVSNREPYVHTYGEDGVICSSTISGVAIALDSVMQACGGIWIAHGAGEADKDVVDSNDRVQIPPDNPKYVLRRIWLSKEEENGYYYGFANEGLWPLSHLAYTRPFFRESDWNIYRKVNEKFAHAILEEVGDDQAFVFIQDYHFALLPRILRKSRPDLVIAQFWHAPWPSRETFRICPWGEEILDGLLGNDLLGFHIRYHCQNFLDTAQIIEAKINYEKASVTRGGRETLIRPFPISIDFEKTVNIVKQPEIEERGQELRKKHRLKDRFVGIGIERIDYIKGILERFKAIDRFFEKYPEYIGRFTFLQLGPISRIHLPEYKSYNDEMYHLAVDINEKYRQKDWEPIVVIKSRLSRKEVISYYRLADVCIISSLHEGMNLVAKEFVTSRLDNSGVLILSKFTGAARELEEALLINPFATDRFADTIKRALEMSPKERARRMRRMREVVKRNNIYRWVAKIIGSLRKLS